MIDYEQIAKEHQEYYGKGKSHLRIYKQLYGDSVAYLHSDFDIREDNESARWLAEKLGVHLKVFVNGGISSHEYPGLHDAIARTVHHALLYSPEDNIERQCACDIDLLISFYDNHPHVLMILDRAIADNSQ